MQDASSIGLVKPHLEAYFDRVTNPKPKILIRKLNTYTLPLTNGVYEKINNQERQKS